MGVDDLPAAWDIGMGDDDPHAWGMGTCVDDPPVGWGMGSSGPPICDLQ